MRKFAHSVEGAAEQDWEPLEKHLSAVGELAATFAEAFGCPAITLAMGLLHDIGKCARAYQEYIRRPRGASGPKGPDHSTAGAREAVDIYGKDIGRLMAFGIAAHHAGLMDGSPRRRCHLPRGGVDRNDRCGARNGCGGSRLPRGGVDRNWNGGRN